MEAKKDLIHFWKKKGDFTGSIFERNLSFNGREIQPTFVSMNQDLDLDLNRLFQRLKLKLQIMPFYTIYTGKNYITLFDTTYRVYFYRQNTYAEFEDLLNAEEVFKLILHEKSS